MARANHGSHTSEKFESNGSPVGNGERQEQTSGVRGGNDPSRGARMLSSTSYLFPPCCWVLSWAHQLIQRPSL